MTNKDYGLRLIDEIMKLKDYRLWLIDEIMKLSDKFDYEYLSGRPIRVLEKIYDNI